MSKKSNKRSEGLSRENLPKKHSKLHYVWVWILVSIRFITRDMWRLRDDELRGMRGVLARILRPVCVSAKAFIDDGLFSKASALTYDTILSIVPMLAVLIGIAKGFGIQQLLSNFLYTYLPSHHQELNKIMGFVDNYFSQIQGGVFVGIGLVILLYTVISLIVSIEDTFNRIWQCSSSRPWGRRIVDYLAIFIIIPILITFSSGLTLVMSTVRSALPMQYGLIAPALEFFLNLTPFFIIIFIFTASYMALPNTKVKFFPALISAVLAGIAFQVLQALYINGVIWISKYNAIYGSFAAIPLMFMFIQVSWAICLFGAQLAFSIQNVRNFAFEQDARSISRRYLDFLTILVASRIVQRFDNVQNDEPYTAEEISAECKIPIKLTSNIIRRLLKMGIIIEVFYKQEREVGHYHPALAPDILTVGYLMQRIDSFGSERFRVDNEGVYRELWQAVLASRAGFTSIENQTLLRDLRYVSES